MAKFELKQLASADDVSNFIPPPGYAIFWLEEVNGVVVSRAKMSDGSIIVLSGSEAIPSSSSSEEASSSSGAEGSSSSGEVESSSSSGEVESSSSSGEVESSSSSSSESASSDGLLTAIGLMEGYPDPSPYSLSIWSVDGGTTWNATGSTIQLPAGTYTITWGGAGEGAYAPASSSVTIIAGQETVVQGIYTI